MSKVMTTAGLAEKTRAADEAASLGEAPGATGRMVENPEDLPGLVDMHDPKAGLEPGHRRELQGIKGALDAQPKVPVFIPQRKPKPGEKPLPPVTVQINDWTYQIPRGGMVLVPAEVARLVRDAGYCEI